MEIAKARPITGLIFGLIFGLALAVLAQQAGLWPLDKLTAFLLPALTALLFVFLAGVGRRSAPAALTVALVLLLAPLAYGLTGIADLGDRGRLDGGCTVEAASDIDTTIVTDTARSNPFDVEADGGLSWVASSPGPITDHEWQVWVVVGGFDFVIAEGAEANTDLTTDSIGDEPTVRGFVDSLGTVAGVEIQGVYEVGGEIDGAGGACNGFGFVLIKAPLFDSVIWWAALVLAVLSLAIFLLIAFTGRERPVAEGEGDRVVIDRDDGVVTTATTGAVAATIADDDVDGTESGNEDGLDLTPDGAESPDEPT